MKQSRAELPMWTREAAVVIGGLVHGSPDLEYLTNIQKAIAACYAARAGAEAETLGRELVEWAADLDNVIGVTDDGAMVCLICSSEDYPDEAAGDVSMADIIHKPDCLHLRALAVKAAKGGAGVLGGEK